MKTRREGRGRAGGLRRGTEREGRGEGVEMRTEGSRGRGRGKSVGKKGRGVDGEEAGVEGGRGAGTDAKLFPGSPPQGGSGRLLPSLVRGHSCPGPAPTSL